MRKKYDIYGIGAALVDTEVQVSEGFLLANGIAKGVMTLVDEARQAELLTSLNAHGAHFIRQSGGSVCNSIVAASHLGAKTFFSGKVANDAEGALFAEDLKLAGATFTAVEAESGVTGKCLVMITDDAERTMNTFLGASDALSVREIDTTALLQAEWFYVEGYLATNEVRTAIIKDAITRAKHHGVKVAVSLSDPFVAEIFGDALRDMIGEGVDLIFCNKDEAMTFTQTDDMAAAVEALKIYTQAFVITDGANGACAFDGASMMQAVGVQAKAIDTNGAGDMFAGAFLYALTSGRDFVWAASLANHAAAKVVEQYGPRLSTAEFDAIKQRFVLA